MESESETEDSPSGDEKAGQTDERQIRQTDEREIAPRRFAFIKALRARGEGGGGRVGADVGEMMSIAFVWI